MTFTGAVTHTLAPVGNIDLNLKHGSAVAFAGHGFNPTKRGVVSPRSRIAFRDRSLIL